MKVLIVATWYPKDRDPVGGVFVEDQALALAARHDVAVIAPEARTLRGLRRDGLRRDGLRRRFEIANRGGIPVARPSFLVPPRRVTGRALGYVYDRQVRSAYRELAKSWGRPDIVHAHVSFPGGWSAVRLGHSLGLPVVVTEHAAPFSFHLEQGGFWRSGAEWTIKNADVTIAVSEGLRRQVREAIGADAVVAGNAFDADFFSPSEGLRPAGPFRFAAVAILTPRKGIDVLLRACRQVLDSGVSGWELVIAGDGPSRAELECLTDELQLREHVRFAGNLDRIGVRDLLRSADAFVLASHHENLPGVVAEAMLTDLPVIATRCGGPEHMVPEGLGRLVPVGDYVGLAGVMSDAIGGEIGGKPGEARALALAEYGREAFLQRIEDIYGQAASSWARLHDR